MPDETGPIFSTVPNDVIDVNTTVAAVRSGPWLYRLTILGEWTVHPAEPALLNDSVALFNAALAAWHSVVATQTPTQHPADLVDSFAALLSPAGQVIFRGPRPRT